MPDTGDVRDSPAAVEYIAERLAAEAGVRWRDLFNEDRNKWRDKARVARRKVGMMNSLTDFWEAAERLDPEGFAKARARDAELEAQRRDAERYRWLRDSNRIPRDADPEGHIVVCAGGGEDVLWGISMDAAIDVAMVARNENVQQNTDS